MIDIFEFNGVRPQLDPKKLGTQLARRSHNLWKASGSFDPLRDGELVANPNGHDWSASNTLFRFEDLLIAPADVAVQFAKSPNIDDTDRRVYFAHNDILQFLRYSDIPTAKPTDLTTPSHRVGVVAPLDNVVYFDPVYNIDIRSGPTIQRLSPTTPPGAAEENVRDIAFVYTYVNKWGEEGPPSIPSNFLTVRDNEDPTATDVLKIGTLKEELTDPNIIGKRVYVTYQGEFFRIGSPSITIQGVENLTVANDVTEVDWRVVMSSVTDLLISGDWDRPPTGIKGLAELNNGMTVAWDDHQLLFNVPYYMHAWPNSFPYRRKIGELIKRVVPIDGGFAVLTDGDAHVYLGTHPANMYAVEMTFNHAITDVQSATKVDNGVVYSTHDGLAFISASTAYIMTDGGVDRRPWAEMVDVETVRGETYEGRYVFMTRDPGNGNAPVGYIYNVASNEFHSFDVDEDSLSLGYYRDPLDNRLLYRLNQQLYSFNDAAGKRQGTWQSGDFMLPMAVNLTACRLEADSYPVIMIVRSGDRQETKTFTSSQPTRFPALGRKRIMSIELQHSDRISSLQIAPDLDAIA